MKLRYLVLAGSAAFCLVYALVPRQEAATITSAAMPQPQAVPALQRPAAAPAAQPPIAAAITTAAPVSLAQRVDQLAKQRDPVSLYAAYKLVRDCRFSRGFAVQALADPAAAKSHDYRPEAETCGDITAGQVATRMQWLNAAADAGVHGAAEDVMKEGPDGDWANLGNPAIMSVFNERAKAQIEAGVRTLDPHSISTAFAWYDSGAEVPRDPVKALTYAVAWQAVTSGRMQAAAKDAVDRLSREVPAESRDEALAAGKALVAQAATTGRTQ